MTLELTAASAFLPVRPAAEPCTPVALTRTSSGWAVVSAVGEQAVGDLVEGMCLADLVVEELGGSPDPDRTARRSARGPHPAPVGQDPRDAQVAALQRTVAQLEHALAARVSTERAIGVLAERHGTGPREAFESLRQSARSQGRAVADLAREVLETLVDRRPAPAATSEVAAPVPGAVSPPPSALPPTPRPPVSVDGRLRSPAAVERRS